MCNDSYVYVRRVQEVKEKASFSHCKHLSFNSKLYGDSECIPITNVNINHNKNTGKQTKTRDFSRYAPLNEFTKVKNKCEFMNSVSVDHVSEIIS